MKSAVLFSFLAGSALAQTAPAAFEVASVKPNEQLGQSETVETLPGTLSMRNVTLITVLKWAY